MVNYYEVLGVENFAPFADIKAAYRRRSKQWHPDLHNGSAIYTEKFKELQEAYSCLNDDNRRTRYDERLRRHLYGIPGEPGSSNYTYTYQTYAARPRTAPAVSERTVYRFLWPVVFILIRMATCHQNDGSYVPDSSSFRIDSQTQSILDSFRREESGDTIFNHATVPESPFPLGQGK